MTSWCQNQSKSGTFDLSTERVRQIIRDEYLRDSTVTVVLVGVHTWQRKFVGWEIGSSIRKTQNNPRFGLLGILLPTYSRRFGDIRKYNPYTIRPRLYKNIKCGFAKIYKIGAIIRILSSHGYMTLFSGEIRKRLITPILRLKRAERAKGGAK